MVTKSSEETVPVFVSTFKEYLDHQHNLQHHVEQDISASPRLRPIEGTTLREDFVLDQIQALGNQLISLEEVSSDSEDDTTPSHRDGTMPRAYWQPKRSKIDILSTAVAQEIAQLTGSFLDPELSRNRVRIHSGNFNDALRRLTNLEPLLVRIARRGSYTDSNKYFQERFATNRNNSNHVAAGNVLVIREADIETRFRLTRTVLGQERAIRIIVSDSAKATIENKCIEELRYYDENNQLTIPSNLTLNAIGAKATSELDEPRIWANFKYPKIGKDLAPQSSSLSKIVRPARSVLSGTVVGSSKFLSLKDNDQIRQWTTDVTEPIDPDSAPPAPPVEESVVQSRRQRKVAVDSDDEDDDAIVKNENNIRSDIVPLPTPPGLRAGSTIDRLMQGADDDERSVVDVVQSSRQRIVRNDSDDSVDDDTSVNNKAEDTENIPPDGPKAEPAPILLIGTSRRTSALANGDDRASLQDNFDGGTGSIGSLRSKPSASVTNVSIPMDKSRRMASSESSRRQILRESRVVNLRTPFQLSTPSRGPNNPRSASLASTGVNPLERNSPNTFVAHEPLRIKTTDTTSRSRQQQGSSQDLLIDFEEETQISSHTYPPPGLGITNTPSRDLSSRNVANPTLLDLNDRNNSVTQPSLKPHAAPGGRNVSAIDSRQEIRQARRSISTQNGDSSALNGPVAPQPPGLNMAAITKAALAKHRKQQEETRMKEAAEETRRKQHQNQATVKAVERERKDPDSPPPVLRKTMRNTAPNPGKKSKNQKPVKQETAKEKRERIAKVKQEAFGDMPASAQPRPQISQPAAATKPEQGTNRAKGIPKIETAVTDVQVKALVDQLKPLFDCSRAFPGLLKFELQLGKVLLQYESDTEGKTWSFKRWNEFFAAEGHRQSKPSYFTNIITRNGADTDRLLNIKDNDKNPIFSEQPELTSISYEFHCQSKDNQEFWVVVDQSGSHSVRKAISTVGFVNLHFPGQVWDASATLHGALSLSHLLKPETEQEIEAFVKSIFIRPAYTKLEIRYRLPNTSEVNIRKLVVRRVSTHECQLPGRGDLALQITEVKQLYHGFRKDDKRLAIGFEKKWVDMVDIDRVQYEVSILSKSISKAFADHNTNLSAGDVTNPDLTGQSLLQSSKIELLLDLVTLVLSKTDWLGFHNFGTLKRKEMEEAERQRNRLHSLGAPGASIIMPATSNANQNVPPLASTPSGRLQPYRTPNNTNISHTELPRNSNSNGQFANGSTSAQPRFHVHGVRANTEATYFEEDGRWYRYGVGAAHVPVTEAEVISRGLRRRADVLTEERVNTEDENEFLDGRGVETDDVYGDPASVLGPDDSSSQVGGPIGGGRTTRAQQQSDLRRQAQNNQRQRSAALGHTRGGSQSSNQARTKIENTREATERGYTGTWWKAETVEETVEDGFW